KKMAEARIKVIGDIPIYCARDSSDVWASREVFQLAADGTPKVVSGVPPDYFSKDGQLWGTPLYDWKKNKVDGFTWWIGRLRGALRQADVVRIDHFRAFESYWEVSAEATTARGGRWVKGPGADFFKLVRKALGDAPFIAEDLGVITKAVRDLRDQFDLPGMKVLQFAFSEGAASPHLPIRYSHNSVCYTGTHDNDTTVGWYEKASDREKDAFRRFTATDGSSCHYHMMRLAFASVANLAIVPMQDVLGLGAWARMNVPGVAKGNWGFKLTPDQLSEGAQRTLRELTELFGRLPGQKEAQDEDATAAA
ncbi:MAG: 4-alpha-glucanotransferase, partial [Deltaproteobacteria bacterium]|nr:4-alpha-glucanotransferase [Deltaproteobacteria bacterium]